MRWFFGLVLVVALIAGALYGVGHFLLPNALSVTRTVSIERPRAAVYAMANDLRLVKNWWPYYNRLDPDEDYTFSGSDTGAGQTMRWRSDLRELGDGRIDIVSSEPYEEIATLVSLERAHFDTVMQITPTQGTRAMQFSAVALTVSAECDEGAVNVPCRYMNLILRRMIERELDAGLLKLKEQVEQLPAVDFEDLQVDFETIEAQPYVYSAVTTSTADAAEATAALTQAEQQVDDFMQRNQLVRAGPQVRVTTDWNREQRQIAYQIGYPYTGPTPLSVVGVQIGQTPAGRYMRVAHQGSWSDLGVTWAKCDAYLRAHGKRADGVLPWGRVLRSASDGSVEIELFFPFEDEPAAGVRES